jgi:hypothetical protein
MMRKGLRGVFVIAIAGTLGWWIVNGFTKAENTSLHSESAQNSESTTGSIFARESEDSDFWIGGVQMNEGDQKNWISELKGSGMNTLEVTVYAHQGRWNENNLWYPDYLPSLIEEIRLAKAAGLKVVMILRLQLDHAFDENKFLWHGMVHPETEYLLHRWFEEYNKFAKKWAMISEEEGVDLFVIGSEMNALFSTMQLEKFPNLESYHLSEVKQKSYHKKVLQLGKNLTSDYLYVAGAPNYTDLRQFLTDRSKCNEDWANMVSFPDSSDQVRAMNVRRAVKNFYWERLIWDLRSVYHGKMTVAANFDNYQDIKFWPLLDCIGINAYFPLRSIDSLGQPNEIYNSWCRVMNEISAFKIKAEIPDHPVVFTELGYAAYSGATLAPWQGGGFSLVQGQKRDSLIIWDKQKQDVSERNLAVRELLRACKDKQFPLAGILYWKFTTHEEQLKEDPFALHIGQNSKDTLQQVLLEFKDRNW